MAARYKRYNATQTVDTLLEERALTQQMLSETSLDDTRHKALATVINMVEATNGERPTKGEDREALVLGWHFIFSHIPTIHLMPLLQSVLQNRNDDYPIAPKNLLHAWNDRYEEEAGDPRLEQSWFRDEHGHYLPAGLNRSTGLYPSGAWDPSDAIEREVAEQKRVRAQRALRTSRLLDDGAQGDVRLLGDGR